MDDIYRQIHDIGIVPVISVNYAKNAASLAKALCDGGLPIAEVTYRTDAGHDILTEMKKACPEMLIGAGDVFTKNQVDSALDAGAAFISARGIDPDLIIYCQSRQIPVIPEVSNASEIETAVALGLDVVKYISAGDPVDIRTIKALSALYPQIKFIPADGINEGNLSEYLNEPCILACSGAWMIDEEAISDDHYEKIEALARSSVNAMLGFSIRHIGINEEDGDGSDLADKFAKLFGGNVRVTSKGWYGSEFVEIMSQKFKTGKHGHIGIGVNNPARARKYYEALGYSFDESTAMYDEDGNLQFIYLNGEIGGFALHILKK